MRPSRRRSSRPFRAAAFGTANVIAFLLLLVNMPASGQEISGIISGTVTDPSDAVVPGAAVKLTLNATGASQNVSTEANGTFAFLNVLPGQYTVSISAKGFKGLENFGLHHHKQPSKQPKLVLYRIGREM